MAVEDFGAAVVYFVVLNSFGYELLSAKKVALAVQVLEWVAAANPGSANAQDSLAEALETAGETARARAAASRALELLPKDASLAEGQRRALEQANRKRLEEERGLLTAGTHEPGGGDGTDVLERLSPR
jgi:predicted Zn-dependent protease